MNNELKLYELIKSNISDTSPFMAMHDIDVAKKLNVSKYSVPNYKKKLINDGYIETKVKVVNNRPITLYKIIKEYTGEVQW